MTDQIELYGRLSPFKPDHLAGFKIGDAVRLPNVECQFQVIGLQPPALLVLRAPSGREVRAGWQAVAKVRTRAEINEGPDAA